MHFLGGRSVKINNVNVSTRRSIFQRAQFVLANVGTCFIFNPSRLIIFTDYENNCRRCKTSNGPRCAPSPLCLLSAEIETSPGVINVNKKPRWLRTRCLISLCLPSFLPPCGHAEREPAPAALGTRNGHGRVSRWIFEGFTRATLRPNEEYAEHFICALGNGKLSFSKNTHFNAWHWRNTVRPSFCDNNTEEVVQRYLNVRL